MQISKYPKQKDLEKLLKRPSADSAAIEKTVLQILNEVKKNGDAALRNYALKFDKAVVKELRVTEKEIKEAQGLVDKKLKQAIETAYGNIKKFHQAQQLKEKRIETTKGVVCWRESRAIQHVGLYIPGGSAPLFSTVLMLSIPASIAGCKRIVLCTPPNKEGKIHPAILFAAQLCGVHEIYKTGGAQAIAAMAYGTETITKVDKIFGPGNQYVTVAKQVATQFGVAIDMPAGPSELLIVADDSAIPSFVASDLLSQAEHGIDSQVILVSTSKKLIDEVEMEINKQIEVLPRKTIAEQAIENSKLIYVENDEIALDLIDEYGPEHFIICTKNDAFYVNNIQNVNNDR